MYLTTEHHPAYRVFLEWLAGGSTHTYTQASNIRQENISLRPQDSVLSAPWTVLVHICKRVISASLFDTILDLHVDEVPWLAYLSGPADASHSRAGSDRRWATTTILARTMVNPTMHSRSTRGLKTPEPVTSSFRMSAKYVSGENRESMKNGSGRFRSGTNMPLMNIRGNLTRLVIIMIADGWSAGGDERSSPKREYEKQPRAITQTRHNRVDTVCGTKMTINTSGTELETSANRNEAIVSPSKMAQNGTGSVSSRSRV